MNQTPIEKNEIVERLNRLEDAILAVADYVESGEWKDVKREILLILNKN